MVKINLEKSVVEANQCMDSTIFGYIKDKLEKDILLVMLESFCSHSLKMTYEFSCHLFHVATISCTLRLL